MSRAATFRLDRKPLIALVDRASRVLAADMVQAAHRHGHHEVKPAHNSVFATLSRSGSRAADMAARAGITRQSMGEVIREMVALGILEMRPDPDDKRAKLVTYSDYGLEVSGQGHEHMAELEQRFAAEFGEAEYESARDVLARLVGLLDQWSAEAEEEATAG